MAASARIDELRTKFDENPRRYFAPLANEYRKAGDLGTAIAICRTQLRQFPTHMSGHVVLGQALFEAGELAEARLVFERAVELDPENLIALRHLGDIARDVGDASAAHGWYRRVLDVDPHNEQIVATVASLAERDVSRPDARAESILDDPVRSIDSAPGPIDAAEAAEPAFVPFTSDELRWAPPTPEPVVVQPPEAVEPAEAAPELDEGADPAPTAEPVDGRPVPALDFVDDWLAAETPEVVAVNDPLALDPVVGLDLPPEDDAAADQLAAIEPAAFEPGGVTGGDAPGAPASDPASEAVSHPASEVGIAPALDSLPAFEPLPDERRPAEAVDASEHTSEFAVHTATDAELDASGAASEPTADGTAIALPEPALESDPEAEPASQPAVPARHAAEPVDVVGSGSDQWPAAEAAGLGEVLSSDAFATETMAELCLEQGHEEEALAIFERVLAQRPSDLALADRVELLRARLRPAVDEAAEPKAGAFLRDLADARPGAVPASGMGAHELSSAEPTERDDWAAAAWRDAFRADAAPATALGQDVATEDAAAVHAATAAETTTVPAPTVEATRATEPVTGSPADLPAEPEPVADEGEISFDHFFAGLEAAEAPPPPDPIGEVSPPPTQSSHASEPAPAAPSEEEDLEEFNAWLRGLRDG